MLVCILYVFIGYIFIEYIYLGNILSYYRLKSRSEITIRHPDDGADDGADDDTLLLSSLVFFLGGERFLGARCS